MGAIVKICPVQATGNIFCVEAIVKSFSVETIVKFFLWRDAIVNIFLVEAIVKIFSVEAIVKIFSVGAIAKIFSVGATEKMFTTASPVVVSGGRTQKNKHLGKPKVFCFVVFCSAPSFSLEAIVKVVCGCHSHRCRPGALAGEAKYVVC